MVTNHIGKDVTIGKLKGTITKQDNEFVLVSFESGANIVFNSQRFTKKQWGQK